MNKFTDLMENGKKFVFLWCKISINLKYNVQMVRHIVIFSLKSDLEKAEKERVMNEFRQGIMGLKEIISCIVDIEVGFNRNELEKGDICLNSLFQSQEDVQAYASHPSHVAVAQKLKPYVAHRVCADYEV